MACFIVPAAEAVVTTVLKKTVGEKAVKENARKRPFLKKINRLNNMLWGGSALLAFEHIWHGEVVPWFPFLTAAADPAQTAQMLREMATSGVAMAALVTAVWAGTVLVSNAIEKRPSRKALDFEGGEKV